MPSRLLSVSPFFLECSEKKGGLPLELLDSPFFLFTFLLDGGDLLDEPHHSLGLDLIRRNFFDARELFSGVWLLGVFSFLVFPGVRWLFVEEKSWFTSFNSFFNIDLFSLPILVKEDLHFPIHVLPIPASSQRIGP